MDERSIAACVSDVLCRYRVVELQQREKASIRKLCGSNIIILIDLNTIRRQLRCLPLFPQTTQSENVSVAGCALIDLWYDSSQYNNRSQFPNLEQKRNDAVNFGTVFIFYKKNLYFLTCDWSRRRKKKRKTNRRQWSSDQNLMRKYQHQHRTNKATPFSPQRNIYIYNESWSCYWKHKIPHT